MNGNGNVAILLQGRRVEVAKVDADRLAESGVAFAYLCKKDGMTMTVPVNDDREGLAEVTDELLLAAYGAANQLADGDRYRAECLTACEKAKTALGRREAALPKGTPMAGVEAQPLHERGTCSLHAEHADVNLWRVRWGDGVEMDLCTRCMASLVFEE